MKKLLFTTAVFALISSVSSATIIVDGVGGATDTYATLQEGIDAALASSSETVIEVRTGTLADGAAIASSTTMVRPLTIQAGNGFAPVISGALSLMPATQDQLITLVGLTISPSAAATDAVFLGTSLTANNCTFVGGSGVTAGINTATESEGTLGVLTLNDCSVTGWYCVFVGRSVKDYIFNRTTILAADQTNGFNYGILNAGNNPIDRGAGVGPDPINAPATTAARTLIMDRTKIKAGVPFAWPVVGPANWNSAYTIGDVTATNCIFFNPVNGYSFIGSAGVPATGVDTTSTFTHCTFHTCQLIVNATNGDHKNVVLNNNLFDAPANSVAALPVYGGSNITFTGTVNAFNIPISNIYSNPPDTNDNLRVMDFGLETHPAIPVGTEIVRSAIDLQDVVTDDEGLLNSEGILLAANQGEGTPVAIDIQGDARPLGGAKVDLGADEVSESATVRDWSVY